MRCAAPHRAASRRIARRIARRRAPTRPRAASRRIAPQFVDSYEFSALGEAITGEAMTGVRDGDANAAATVEHKPMFHEWATIQPGMICLARKKKTAVFRQYIAAETAVPVIGCAACLPIEREADYFFAGVARSKSVRSPDDGIGPNGARRHARPPRPGAAADCACADRTRCVRAQSTSSSPCRKRCNPWLNRPRAPPRRAS